MKTIELFSGIGGFRCACDKLGIETVFANDIDSTACNVYKDNFGDSVIIEGKIEDYIDEIPKHDLLTAGFPCQPFSSAGKKKGLRDIRGTLFQQIVTVLKNRQPKYFVLENVKRLLQMEKGFHFDTVLKSLVNAGYQVEWRIANTMWFNLPQNRPRIILSGIRNQNAKSKKLRTHLLDKIEVNSMNETLISDLNKTKNAYGQWGIVGKDFGITANKIDDTHRKTTCILKDVLEKKVLPKYDLTETTLKWIHKNVTRNKFVNGVQIISNQSGGARMGYTIFGLEGLSPTLTCTTSRHYERYKFGNRYRRLMPMEYARLQGFPEDHCDSAKHGEQYILYGNSIAPPMAQWAIESVMSKGYTLQLREHKQQQFEIFA